MPNSRLQVFSCNSNPTLARAICEHIGIPMGDAQVGKFSDGEIHV
jgi:ribose-phosphate pyrophosphokinase